MKNKDSRLSASVQGAAPPCYGEVQIRNRGYLPHWEKDSGLYFVTFRLVDSLPREVLETMVHLHRMLATAKRSGIKLSPSQEALLGEYNPKKIEEYIDKGAGSCYLCDSRIAAVVADALRSGARRKYRLIAWCIMLNHVHVVFRLFPGRRLTEVLKSWKSYSARKANHLLGREGVFWQREYYDRLIRNGGELDRAVRYVATNPERAGLKNWRWVWSEDVDVLATAGWSPALRKAPLLLRRRNVRDRQIPMPGEDLEAALFFFLVGFLIGPELFDECLLIGVGAGRDGRVLVDDGHAIVPAAVFGGVIARLIHPNLEHPAHFHFLL